MKRKNLWGILLAFLLLLPMVVKAEMINLDNYEQKDLEETLESENIEFAFTDYKETNDQVTIYMFRGHGCGYCYNFLNFLNSITDEYGKMFKLRSFEIWNDTNNSNLLDKMKEITGTEATGVPFIIIGEKVFKGYIDDWDQEIIDAIKTEYDKKEKFDYFEKYNSEEKKTLGSVDNTLTIIVVVVADVFTIIIIIYFQNKNHKEMIRYINRLYKKSLKKVHVNKEEVSEEIIDSVDEDLNDSLEQDITHDIVDDNDSESKSNSKKRK